jgi:hypothetical protein
MFSALACVATPGADGTLRRRKRRGVVAALACVATPGADGTVRRRKRRGLDATALAAPPNVGADELVGGRADPARHVIGTTRV